MDVHIFYIRKKVDRNIDMHKDNDSWRLFPTNKIKFLSNFIVAGNLELLSHEMIHTDLHISIFDSFIEFDHFKCDRILLLRLSYKLHNINIIINLQSDFVRPALRRLMSPHFCQQFENLKNFGCLFLLQR